MVSALFRQPAKQSEYINWYDQPWHD